MRRALTTLLGVVVAVRNGEGDRPIGSSAELVARDYVACVNADDWTHVRALLAASFVFHDGGNGFVQGRSGFLVWSQVLRDSYPDLAIEVADVRVAGDVATVEFRATAARDDPRRCAPRPHDVLQIRVRQGLVVEMWSAYRELGLGC